MPSTPMAATGRWIDGWPATPHGIAIDSEGSVYIAEVSYTAVGSTLDPPGEVISMRKWLRVSR